MVCAITQSQYVDFSKERDGSKSGIVSTMKCIYDLEENGDMTRKFGEADEEVEVSYGNATSIRTNFPVRFQAKLRGLSDLSLLDGSLYVSPKCNIDKWVDKKDEKNSTMPVFLLTKSATTLHEVGVNIEDYPSINSLIDQFVNKTEEVSEAS